MHGSPIDYPTATAGELAAALAARRVSAVELLEAAVARIERLDGAINAVVVRDFARARKAAEAADAALARGERRKLLGVPMTVKESFDIAGLPTTWGMEDGRARVVTKDALAVARLKAAGAVILGKTNVPPSLADWQANNPIHGRTNNPHDLSRSPGGSSGGAAAALAVGFVPLELGSDIGGSIRVPAAFCGVFGHKPSYDLIPTTGHSPVGGDCAPSLMSVVGPLARSAADLALALDVLAGPDAARATAYRLALPQPRHERPEDYRVLVLDGHPAAAADGEIRAALDRLARDLAAEGVAVARESQALPDLAAAHETYLMLLQAAMSRGAPPENPIPVNLWLDGLDAQKTVERQWATLFRDVDLVIAPALGTVAFPHDTEPAWPKRVLTIDGAKAPFVPQLAWPGMASLANLPATVVPAGQTRTGLPIGAQIIGPYLEDRTPLAFAAWLERALGVTPLRPDL